MSFKDISQTTNKGFQTIEPSTGIPDNSTLGIIKNTILGLPKAAVEVGGDILHGITRSLGSTGLTLTGQKEIVPQTPFEKKVFNFVYGGEEPVKNIQTRVAESKIKIEKSPFAQKYGIDKYATPLAFAGVLGGTGLDLSMFGGIEKNAIKTLAKETSIEGVTKILSKMKISDDVIKEFAPKLVQTSSPSEIKDALSLMKNTQNIKTLNAIPETNLINKAKKYKSAEDFVKSIPGASESLNNLEGEFSGQIPKYIKAFHGTTNKAADSIGKEGYKIIDKQRFGRYTGDGVYFSPEKGGTARFSAGGKELDGFIDTSNYKTVYLPEGNIDWQPGSDLVNEWKRKYDGVIVRLKDTDTVTGKVEADWVNEIVVYNTNSVKTKSQLEEIWKKANSEIPQVTQELSAVQKITQALKEAKPLRKEQEALYTKERGLKMEQAQKVGADIGGEAGYAAQLSELKGGLSKIDFTPIRDKIKQPDIDSLFTQIQNHPELSFWDSVTARNGLSKILEGRLPTEGEITHLNKVFPKEFISEVMKNRSLWQKIQEGTMQVANIPRAVMSSFDLSAPFRQGLFLINKPKQFFGAFGDMFKSFGSEKAFNEIQRSISQKPLFKQMLNDKLALTDLKVGLNKREEQFMSSWAEKIPLLGKGIRASGRAYTGFLNKIRADVYEDLVKKAGDLAIDNPKLTKEIAKFINTATGRGSLEKTAFGNLERSAVALNSFFFSPRLMASRLTLLNPAYYIKASPFVRKEALKSLLTLAGVTTTVLTLAKLGGAEVENNPTSSDFGKIKIGNTRVDTLGGFQQYIVAATRLLTGEYTSTVSGQTSKLGEGYKALSRYDIAMRQIESKEAPIISFITRLLKQKDAQGKPISIPKETIDLFTPMTIGALIDIAKDDPKLLPLSALGSFGIGVQTYEKSGSGFGAGSSNATKRGFGSVTENLNSGFNQ